MASETNSAPVDAPKLGWGRFGVETDRFRLSAFPSSDRSGEFYWTAWLKIGNNDLEQRIAEGYAPEQSTARGAAEAAAVAWLSDGMAPFGLRGLTPEPGETA